jgi:general secretion pathway protein D
LPEATFSEYWSGTETVISDKPLLNTTPMTPALTRGQQIREQQLQQRQRELNEPIEPPVLESPDTPVPPEASIPSPDALPPPPEPASTFPSSNVTTTVPGMSNNVNGGNVQEQSPTTLPTPKVIP